MLRVNDASTPQVYSTELGQSGNPQSVSAPSERRSSDSGGRSEFTAATSHMSTAQVAEEVLSSARARLTKAKLEDSQASQAFENYKASHANDGALRAWVLGRSVATAMGKEVSDSDGPPGKEAAELWEKACKAGKAFEEAYNDVKAAGQQAHESGLEVPVTFHGSPGAATNVAR
ncbi:MAG TPA: hypothetical protein VHA82_12670 [Ramlibacter sp.]|uniref:hypothetical protein n=1 Tax=Ramlibacter sp. TaxID=1917967 RepID=UPI002BD68407|nr:hypothetical protein [Ramlibacter sp.]HVZ44655.1 hypothetical protein [Ramlibacter sp.]